MNYRFYPLVLLLALLCNFSFTRAANVEAFINDHVQQYQLHPDNLFRLSAYTELKGQFQDDGEVKLDFGNRASLSFYPQNLLLRVRGKGVYHLNRGEEMGKVYDESINEVLDEIFEGILLLSNGDASEAHIAFVDEQLTQKNLDPFHKLFLRYLMLHHGRFDSVNRYVEFYSGWLPSDDEYAAAAASGHLGMQMSSEELRGYYFKTGSRVYLKNVERPVSYATGEVAGANVTAFKLFLQDLMGHSVHYLLDMQGRVAAQKISYETFGTPTTEQVSNAQNSTFPQGKETPVLYHEYHWIPMMLGLLHANGTSFSDPEVICYFVDAPYYDLIYSQLSAEEKAQADQYLAHQE